MKIFVLVYQNERNEWDADVSLFSTKEKAQSVMYEQFQNTLKTRKAIIAKRRFSEFRWHYGEDQAEICDDYECEYDQWKILEKEIEGC